jgi:hypothetical protein
VLLAHLILFAFLQGSSSPDKLADLASRRRAAGEDAVAHVEVARWCFMQGLLDESIAELDRVLERDPEQSDARALIASAPLKVTLPAPAERSLGARLILFGARAKPAYRELAASRFAALPADDAAADLDRAFRSPSASVRAFAAFAARRRDPAPQATALVRRAVLDPAEPVRLEAARSLRDAKDETLARRVEAALADGDPRIRTNAAQSLGTMSYRSSVPALMANLAAPPPPAGSSSHPGGTRAHIYVGSQVAYVRDFDPQIAQGASIQKPIVGSVEDATVLDVRVGGTSTQTVQVELPTLFRSLAQLTGERLPETRDAWLEWWKRNAPPAPSTGSGGSAGSGGSGG